MRCDNGREIWMMTWQECRIVDDDVGVYVAWLMVEVMGLWENGMV